MGNVWEAMKKSEAEQERRAVEQPPAPPAAPAGQPTVPARTVSASGAASNNYSPALATHHDRGGTIAEEYRSLRTHLMAIYPEERFCLVVTSAVGGEGKTVTTLNLGLTLAERQERRTIVIDADMRKGKVAEYLQADPSPGLADLLRGGNDLPDVIRKTVYPNLFYVPSGMAGKEEVGELVARPELHELIARLRREYDYVLFDSPPVNPVADAAVLSRAVGDALVVVRMNKTDREETDRAIRVLRAANVKVSGLVLTHRRYFMSSYRYYRYYRYT